MKNPGLIIAGGLVLAGGIGYAIYAATKPKVLGTAFVPGSETTNAPPTGAGVNIGQLKDMFGNLVSATKESFPLRIGMVGPNVKALQTALSTKFNKTSVSTDGIFGVKTWTALKELGYVTLVLNTLSEADYNNVLAGKAKTVSADGSKGYIGGAGLGSYVGLINV